MKHRIVTDGVWYYPMYKDFVWSNYTINNASIRFLNIDDALEFIERQRKVNEKPLPRSKRTIVYEKDE